MVGWLSADSRTNIPHLHTKDIKLDTFVGKRLVPECLARGTDAFFEAGVDPETVVAVSARALLVNSQS